MVIPIIIPYSRKVKAITPIPKITNWNLSEDPVMFAHLTDIHINHVVPGHLDNFNSARDWIEDIQPEFFVITGDLCDNFPGTKFPKYGHQQPEDHELYNKSISNLTVKNFIDIPGNHDEFGVFGYDTPAHNFIKGRNLTKSEFLVSKNVYTYQNQKIHIVKINAFHWPSAHPPFVFFPIYNRQLLDQIEQELIDVKEEDVVIFLSHYPVNLFDDVTSSSGRTLPQIVKTSNFSQYFISGHLHPQKSFVQHQGDNLEVVGADLAYDNNFGMFSLDHNRFVYTDIENKEKKSIFVTSPVPTNQISGHTPFSELDSYIRIRAFQDKEPNITVSGDVSGKMECRKSNSKKGFVCSLHFTFDKPGVKHIKFDGDYTEELEFVVNQTIASRREKDYENSHWKYWIFDMALIWILLTFIVIPTPLPKSIDDHEDWVNGVSSESHYLYSFIFSLLIFKHRFSHVNLPLRIFFIVLAVYPIFMPTTFIEIDGHVGIIWTYGFVCGGDAVRTLWGQIYTLLFNLLVIMPGTYLASSLAINNPFVLFPFLVDMIFVIICIGIHIKVLIRNLSESAGILRMVLSPAFVFIPIASYVWIIVDKFMSKRASYENL